MTSISFLLLLTSCHGDKKLTNKLTSQIVSNYKTSINVNTRLCFKNDNSEIANILKTLKNTKNRDSTYNRLGIDNPFIKKKPIVKRKLELFLSEENYLYALQQENKKSI